MALSTDRPISIPKPGRKLGRTLGASTPPSEPTASFLDETDAVNLGLEWHSDTLLLEDSE